MLLALVHGAGDDRLGNAGIGDLVADQEIGDHSEDLPAPLEHGVGQDPHEADATPAVDQADAAIRHQAAELERGLAAGRVRSHLGTTEYAK